MVHLTRLTDSRFQSGNVDSIAVWDQYFATAQLQPGAKVVADGRDLESLNYLFAWVTRDWAEANPEQLQTFIADLRATSEAAKADPQSGYSTTTPNSVRERTCSR